MCWSQKLKSTRGAEFEATCSEFAFVEVVQNSSKCSVEDGCSGLERLSSRLHIVRVLMSKQPYFLCMYHSVYRRMTRGLRH